MILPHLPCCQTGPTLPLNWSSVPQNGFFLLDFIGVPCPVSWAIYSDFESFAEMLLFTQKACTEAWELWRIWDLHLLAQQHIGLPQSNGFWQEKRDSRVKDKAQFIAQSSSSNQGIRVRAAFPSTAPYSVTSKGKGYFSWGPVFRGLQLGIPRLLCSEVNLHGLHLKRKISYPSE